MRVIHINDCAYVGETLLKNFPPWLRGVHVKKIQSLWGKTFGIAWKILAMKGDIFHAHYLLQDCYLASRFGKHPLVGHGHGSDLRETLRHPLYGRIVRHNLKTCDKVLVSTPDLLKTAKKLAKDVEYLPNVIDTEFFFPAKFRQRKERLKVFIGSSADWRKGTDIAIDALSQLRDEVEVSLIGYGPNLENALIKAKSLGLEVKALPKVLHKNMSNYYWNSDIVLDQFKCGTLGVMALEAISCGRPVITYASSEYEEYKDFPLKDINSSEKIVSIIQRRDDFTELWKNEYSYVRNNHEVSSIISRTVNIYEELLGV